MQTAIIRLFILVAIFATIFLITQLLFATVLRGRLENVAVNRRLKMIAGGTQREVVIASLRKNSPRYDENYPPFVRNVLNHFRRMLLASGLNISMGQVMLMMAGLVFAITVLLMFVARSAKIPLTLGVMEIILTFGVAVPWRCPCSSLTSWRSAAAARSNSSSPSRSIFSFARCVRGTLLPRQFSC